MNDFDQAQLGAQLYNTNTPQLIGQLKNQQSDFKLSDLHLGEPNANGVRPVNDAGKAAIMSNFNASASKPSAEGTLPSLHVDQSMTGNPTPTPDLPAMTYGIKSHFQKKPDNGFDMIGNNYNTTV